MLKRPLCIATVLYIIGILIGLYLQISIAFLLIICFIISLIVYLLANKKIYIIAIFILFLGVIHIKIIDMGYENKYYILEQQEEVTIRAVVISEPIEKQYKYIYEIKSTEILGVENNKYEGTHWLLNIKKSANQDLQQKQLLKYGDLIEIKGNIEIPSEARNYKGFDYRKYLKSQGICANINVNENIKILAEDRASIIEKILHDIAIDMKKRIYQLLPEDVRELCMGILIGERSGISEQINTAFRDSNLTHMLAISGAHISYIVTGISILLSKTEKKFSKVFTIVFLIFFMGLTKYTASVERASIMSILTLLAGLLHRKSDVYNNMALSAIVILISNPYSILNIGFQLSFGGTIGIICFQEKISQKFYQSLHINTKIEEEKKIQKYSRKIKKYVVDILSVTISANIVITPIMAFQFHTVSFTFWISNMLASPLLCFITILGFILYFISILSIKIASIIAFPLTYIIQFLIYIANFCSKLPFSSVRIKTPYIFEIIIYYFVIYFIFYLKAKRKNIKKIYLKTITIKMILVSLIIIFLLNSIFIILFYKYASLKIYFIDVGQGDSTLICTPTHKTILIDGGGSEMSSFNVGEQILLPYLLNRRINTINYMIISHFDSDHVGGLLTIMEELKVENVIISKQGENSENYEEFKKIVNRKKIKIIIVEKGDIIKIEKNISIQILWPTAQLVSENILNNNSIVAKFCYNGFSMLLTGDIEQIAEEKILGEYKDTNVLQATILKVAHHGSKTSSTQKFLEQVKPKVALIGVRENNTFGHPNDEVLERLQDLNCKIYRTDENGEIEIKVNQKGQIRIKN